MGLGSTVEGVLDSKCGVLALVVYSVVSAIYSITMSSIAYSRFNSGITFVFLPLELLLYLLLLLAAAFGRSCSSC
jgi:hypothetical protein